MGILLTILGFILSIIKFILLFILFLIVLVLFVVAVLLFVPINYSLEGEYDSTTKTDNIHAKVFYSLKFIYVDYNLKDRKNSLYVKLFGWRVYDTDKEEKPKKSVGKKKKKVKKDKEKDVNQEKNETIENVVPVVDENDNEKIELELQKELERKKKELEENENIENIEQVVPIDEEAYKEKVEAEIEENLKKEKMELEELERQNKEEIKEIIENSENITPVGDNNNNEGIDFALEKAIEKEKRELEKREEQKKEEIKAKIEEEKEKSEKDPKEPSFIDKVKVWLDIYENYPEKDKIFQKTKNVFIKTYKTIKPKEFKLDAHLGFKDAAQTGSIVGKIYAVAGALALTNISVVARFDQEIVKGKLYVAGKITIFRLLSPVISLGMQLLSSEAKRRNTTRFKLIKSLIKSEAK